MNKNIMTKCLGCLGVLLFVIVLLCQLQKKTKINNTLVDNTEGYTTEEYNNFQGGEINIDEDIDQFSGGHQFNDYFDGDMLGGEDHLDEDMSNEILDDNTSSDVSKDILTKDISQVTPDLVKTTSTVDQTSVEIPSTPTEEVADKPTPTPTDEIVAKAPEETPVEDVVKTVTDQNSIVSKNLLNDLVEQLNKCPQLKIVGGYTQKDCYSSY